MRMVRPQLDAPQITIAEDQEEYKPVTAALVTHPAYGVTVNRDFNTVLLAFRPSDDERAKLAAGEDIYVSLLTFGTPMQAIIVGVGADEASSTYNVPVAK